MQPLTAKAARVFISYTTRDGTVAGEVCRRLEDEGIPCWIAPRDIPPGHEWPAEIDAAIKSCRAVVLILSSRTSTSRPVCREIEKAEKHERTIIPLRLEAVEPTGSLAFFVG